MLSQINVSTKVPDSLTELISFVNDQELPDGIEAFVQIRNALVHCQEEKRKKLKKIDDQILYDANDLGLWYLELAILNILNYTGKYQSRCVKAEWKGSNYRVVPWAE